MNARPISIAAASCLVLTACSSRPRQFVPSLASPAADAAAYEAEYQNCRTLVAQGQRSGFGPRAASGGVGVAAAAGAGAATMAGSGATLAGAAGAASAAVVMMPVVGVFAAWGLAKASKARKEKAVKQATALCLSERGYAVAGWKRAPKGTRRAKA